MMSYKNFLSGLRSSGIVIGDDLCVQSSYNGINGVEGGIVGIIDALKECVGKSGSIIMPAYNFNEWTKDHYFDHKETCSSVGNISEIFRMSDGVRRTKHPIHSLSVWGVLQDELCEIDSRDSFGVESVFAALLSHNIIYSTLGLGTEMPFLSCHFTETSLGVPYRQNKNFSGLYVGENGETSVETYGFYVKKKQYINVKSPIYQTHVWLNEIGIFKGYEFSGCSFYHGRAKDYENGLKKLIYDNPRIFGWTDSVKFKS